MLLGSVYSPASARALITDHWADLDPDVPPLAFTSRSRDRASHRWDDVSTSGTRLFRALFGTLVARTVRYTHSRRHSAVLQPDWHIDRSGWKKEKKKNDPSVEPIFLLLEAPEEMVACDSIRQECPLVKFCSFSVAERTQTHAHIY